jgi:hypothetical protein
MCVIWVGQSVVNLHETERVWTRNSFFFYHAGDSGITVLVTACICLPKMMKMFKNRKLQEGNKQFSENTQIPSFDVTGILSFNSVFNVLHV